MITREQVRALPIAADLLPMAWSYLDEDRDGRLMYIAAGGYRLLVQVLEIEVDEDLWLAAAAAKKEILEAYEEWELE